MVAVQRGRNLVAEEPRDEGATGAVGCWTCVRALRCFGRLCEPNDGGSHAAVGLATRVQVDGLTTCGIVPRGLAAVAGRLPRVRTSCVGAAIRHAASAEGWLCAGAAPLSALGPPRKARSR